MAIAQQGESKREIAHILLFASTLFCSAALMFVLQPMFGKVLLPLLGGAPSVWNTCMVFFQTVLFLGYLYAHWISSRLTLPKQLLLHGSVLLVSALSLPVALSSQLLSLEETGPTLWLLTALTASIGLPFFVLSTTAPLLQKWFSKLGHASSDDPYYLYVASNVGSLISLLGYPFLLEPRIGLTEQQTVWSFGFAVLCAGICSCMAALWLKRRVPSMQLANTSVKTSKAPTLNIQFRWLALALVPSSLLLALTNYISTDIAAVPLLWVIPLALYLLSFIIVFSKYGAVVHKALSALFPWVIVPFLAYYFSNQKIAEYSIEVALHFLVFFLTVMVCHGELAKTRPNSEHLTQYYLIMSFGGMLGGMVNTFVAPQVFDNVYEYPLMMIAGLWLMLPKKFQLTSARTYPVTIGIVASSVVCGAFGYLYYIDRLSHNVLIGLLFAASLAYLSFWQKTLLSSALALVVIVSCAIPIESQHANALIHQSRNFYGVLSIRQHSADDIAQQNATLHVLRNGTTEHGSQLRTAESRCMPTGYYSQKGPLGQLFNAYDADNAQWNIGIIGLGAGEIAAYAKPSQQWSFYELNPTVVDIAENPDYFSFLQDCVGDYRVQVGDARLMLEKEKQQQYDLLIVDAFSSDSIPTHLMTKEAIELFLTNMKPGGLLAFHISNRHLALKKVLSVQAKELGLANAIQEFRPKTKIPYTHASDWVMMAKEGSRLQPLLQSQTGHWTALSDYPEIKGWTDDYSSIISLWKFGKET